MIKNVNIFTGKEYIEKTNFVFNNSEIIAITNNLDSFKNLQIIDGADRTIIPPLANAHIHL